MKEKGAEFFMSLIVESKNKKELLCALLSAAVAVYGTQTNSAVKIINQAREVVF